MNNSAQIQLSFFGPGYGESIVMLVGNQILCQIDCCRPAADFVCETLSDSSIRPGFFLLTHPHFDHYGSFEHIGDIEFEAICRFHGMPADELRFILKKRAKNSLNMKYRDSARSFSNFLKRWRTIPDERRLLVSKNTIVWQELINCNGDEIEFKVSALAPSAGAVEQFNRGLVPAFYSDTRGQSSSQSNNASVVLVVQFGSTRVLLTGDVGLEEWRRMSAPKVNLLKLPHHGSGKDNTLQTTEAALSSEEAIVVVTPFFANHLPDEELLQEIVDCLFGGRSGQVLVTRERQTCSETERRWGSVSPTRVAVARMDGDGQLDIGFDAHGNRLN